MQEQEKMEMVWQAPELVELGDVMLNTQNTNNGVGSDSNFPGNS